MEIGKKLKEYRVMNGLTQEELASRCELSKGFLSQIENDLTSPSISTLDDIVEALGIDLTTFFKEDKQEQFVFLALLEIYFGFGKLSTKQKLRNLMEHFTIKPLLTWVGI